MSGLAGVMELSNELIWLHFIVLLRVGPVIALFPGLGEGMVPVRVKLAVILVFTVAVAPSIAPQIGQSGPIDQDLAWLILTETGIGLMIGVGVRLLLLALQTAGSMAAQATSLSQILGSAGVTPLPAMGHFLVIGGVALAMMMGLHVRLAQMMVLTYGVLPMGEMPSAALASQWGVRQVADAFALAFALAAPFVIVSVLYNLTLGIINRAMPQLMVVFVGAPVITAGGLFLLMLLAPTMLGIWVGALEMFIENPLGAR